MQQYEVLGWLWGCRRTSGGGFGAAVDFGASGRGLGLQYEILVQQYEVMGWLWCSGVVWGCNMRSWCSNMRLWGGFGAAGGGLGEDLGLE